ncbi:unnamed protein product [Lactuca saligna]|uniref:non-specific serine/threonine protein kinase n=1 Tax=Lactuca saligna TaxID=75948 RepID=A0AA36DYR7_LACSI|nr:unnamed protein product [Lactuca saligna]
MCFTKSNSLVRILVLLCFSRTINLSSGVNTISASQSLSGDQTIVSKDEVFELGFFKAGNSSKYYIGIWYNKVSSNPPTIVWVANRETPISDRFRSELKIINGNLVLLNESKFQIWSTNVSTTTTLKSVIAVLLDGGNLVLRDSTSNSIEPFWQSFEHPTHTWLPGAKLAYDNRTKKSQLLTSWRSKEDPGVGLFSLELDPFTTEYISKWNGSQRYWTSGAWNGKIFELVPEMRLNYIYNFSYQTNENESYFTYSVYNPSIISRFIMDVSGQVQQLTWLEASKQWNLFWSQPRTQCEVYALCGAFGTCSQSGLPFCNCLTGFKPRSESDWNQSDFSGGCVRKTDLQCGRNVEKADFLKITVKSLPPNKSMAVGSAGECRTTCLNSCSCNAYSFVDNQCLVWNGDLLNLSEDNDNDSGKTIFVKVASKDLPRHKKTNWVTVGAVVGFVGGVVFVLGVTLVLIFRKKRISVVNGKRNAEQSEDSRSPFFPCLASNVLKVGGDVLSLVDRRLNREASVEEVSKICKVACWCIQDEEDSRPSMSLVEQILEGVMDVNMPPIPRSVTLFVDNTERVVFFTESPSKESSSQSKSSSS